MKKGVDGGEGLREMGRGGIDGPLDKFLDRPLILIASGLAAGISVSTDLDGIFSKHSLLITCPRKHKLSYDT